MNQSFKYCVGTKPLHSDIIEKSDKISYMVRMDPKPEVDPETGESIIKPQIFCDSAMDNP